MEKLKSIYCRTNKYNGKEYIGQTCKTMQERARTNGNGYKGCPKFWADIEKYGWLDEDGNENFPATILESGLTQEEADIREQYWITEKDTVKNGYNTSKGGNGLYGICDEPRSEEWSRHISESHKGTNASDETKKKMSESHKGHFVSKETKQKQRDSNRNNPKQDCRKVRRYTLDGVFLKEYPSIKEAERQTGIKGISHCCRGVHKTAGKNKWSYA